MIDERLTDRVGGVFVDRAVADKGIAHGDASFPIV